jgi:hypothetical protein
VADTALVGEPLVLELEDAVAVILVLWDTSVVGEILELDEVVADTALVGEILELELEDAVAVILVL